MKTMTKEGGMRHLCEFCKDENNKISFIAEPKELCIRKGNRHFCFDCGLSVITSPFMHHNYTIHRVIFTMEEV